MSKPWTIAICFWCSGNFGLKFLKSGLNKLNNGYTEINRQHDDNYEKKVIIDEHKIKTKNYLFMKQRINENINRS